LTLSPAITARTDRAGLERPTYNEWSAPPWPKTLRYGPDATTTATVPADAVAIAELTTRTAGFIAGIRSHWPCATQVTDRKYWTAWNDGTRLQPGQPAMTLRGSGRACDRGTHRAQPAVTRPAWPNNGRLGGRS